MYFVIVLFIYANLIGTYNTTALSCGVLSKLYPDATFFPGTTRYNFQNTFSWSATAWLGPACVFCPYKAAMVSEAVQLFSLNQTPFSIRSGGTMPVSDAANIGPEDKSILSVGYWITWPVVYDFLESYNVVVNGIRIGNAGVVGFLLGGGIGFFSYEHGIAATGVFSFECVLADGTSITASETSHSDLVWALRGGGNSATVTSVKLKTINSSLIQIGNVSFGTREIVKTQYIQSVVDFAIYAGSDPKSAIEGQVRFTPAISEDITYWAFLFHNGNDNSPPGLVNLTAPVLPFTYGTVTEQTMGSWADSFKAGFAGDTGLRELFYFFSLPADPLAFRIAMDTYFSFINETLSEVEGFFTAFSIMPITPQVIVASAANGGNPLGLTASSVPALESPTWALASDDTTVVSAHAEANVQINAALAAAGFSELPFVYLSHAEKGQSVFPAYGEENLQRLKSIRDFYDPGLVYTVLLKGGIRLLRPEKGVMKKLEQ